MIEYPSVEALVGSKVNVYPSFLCACNLEHRAQSERSVFEDVMVKSKPSGKFQVSFGCQSDDFHVRADLPAVNALPDEICKAEGRLGRGG